MSTKLIRIPLAWPIGTRSGIGTTKDPYIFNGMKEAYGEKLYVVKRPGTTAFITLGTGGTSQGVFYFNGFYYGVVDDVLYRSSGTLNSGTSGLFWTTGTTPAWPPTQGMGSCVYKNRMFLIGGKTSSAGIWSTVDGVVWTVNAGGQPWGFRNHPGVVVYQDKIFVLGGYNLTLGSTFNDVWSSSDGTNWVNISPDTGALTMWNTRTNHCCVANSNGIYVYGGEDTVGPTFYDDIWYSADGISWTQLNTAATGTARADATMYWFHNKLWIVGGFDGANALNDVWSSPDGITWTQETAAAFSSGGRSSFYSCIYHDKMWAMGGINTGSTRLSDVFSSVDGINWVLVATIGFSPRADGACMVFGVPTATSPYNYQTMYLLGGDNGVATVNDVLFGTLDVNQPTSFALNPDVLQQPYQFNTYVNGQLLLIKNQSNGWVLQSGELIKITDTNYPTETVPGIVVLNAFAYVMTPKGEIHACKLDHPLVWPVLQFITADYEDDPGVVLGKYLNYVVAFSQFTIQFFYDNGAIQVEGSPLAPYINANLRVGCANADSVANISNTLFWVAQTRQGTRYVAMFNGLSDQHISTPYVDKILAAATNLVGFGCAAAGHFFYVLKTGVFTALVYDITQQEWYEWDTFGYGAFLANGNVGGNYLFSTSGGNLVAFDPLYYTDVLLGNFTFFPLTDKIDFGNTALKYHGRVTLVGDTSPATPDISWTDNDYQTYVSGGTVDMTLERPYITRLGSARRRAWKPNQTDNNPARWEALEVEYSQGES